MMERSENICQKDIDSSNAEFNILILGDGNFSFSLSLLKRLQRIKKCDARQGVKYKIVASSFDSAQEIKKKYSDSDFILTEFKRDVGSSVFHDVDATKLENCDIFRMNLVDERRCQTNYFTDIIFNFPHLGKEDCIAHSSLLSHIMHSAKHYMVAGLTTLTIALAEAQGVLWKIKEMATLNGLELTSQVQFNESEWPGYVLKRHHTGRTFKDRVQQCVHYSFRMPNNTNNNTGTTTSPVQDSVLRFLQLHSPPPVKVTISGDTSKSNDNSVIATDVHLTDNNGADVSNQKQNQNSGTSTEATVDVKSSKQNKKKRTKMEMVVDGQYQQIVTTDGGGVTVNSVAWQCGICNKVIDTEQGIKTHVYIEHFVKSQKKLQNTEQSCGENNNTAEATSSAHSHISSQSVFQCEYCDKKASNIEALEQHVRAKHHCIHSDIKPDWALATVKEKVHSHTLSEDACDDVTTSVATGCSCQVCGLHFLDEQALQQHMTDGFIPQNIELTYTCDNCNKVFSNDRALKQHQNFCLCK